jgi:hypothetical protein
VREGHSGAQFLSDTDNIVTEEHVMKFSVHIRMVTSLTKYSLMKTRQTFYTNANIRSVPIKYGDWLVAVRTVNATLNSSTPFRPLECALCIEDKLVNIASVVLELRKF